MSKKTKKKKESKKPVVLTREIIRRALRGATFGMTKEEHQVFAHFVHEAWRQHCTDKRTLTTQGPSFDGIDRSVAPTLEGSQGNPLSLETIAEALAAFGEGENRG